MYTAKILLPGDDTADVIRVRTAVFVDEQGFSAELEFDDIDPVCHHVLLYEGETPIATGRVFPAEEVPGLFVIGRVAVCKEYRGGTGRLLMMVLETTARELGACAVTLGAQERVVHFYETLGYVPYGEIYMDEFCPHINMRKQL